MNIAIAGFGQEGEAALAYWQKPGNSLTICDNNPDLQVPEGVASRLGPDYLKNLSGFDVIVRTPGLHPQEIAKANPETPDILSKVTSGTNEFFEHCPTKNIIGITGTKGKGTTSSLVAKILEAAGKTVHLGGNIGVAPLAMLQNNIQPDDWVVLELSNFQLIDCRHSPAIAACLMIVPEHLNWHADFAEYLGAKRNIFTHQTAKDHAVFNRLNEPSSEISQASPAHKVSYEVPALGAKPTQTVGAYVDGDMLYIDGVAVCKTTDTQLLGRHNLENICAAIALTWSLVEHNAELLKQAIQNFKGLEHRLEFFAKKNDVNYYDDSFAATPDAAIAALTAIPGQKVMIVGGFDRGLPLEHLAQAYTDNQASIREALLIGASAERLSVALRAAGFSKYQILTEVDMPAIVSAATAAAQPDDGVVLSPGFASFDMFKNFEDRGQQFKQAVEAL